jgi:pilus assembly protein Flp/PilA
MEVLKMEKLIRFFKDEEGATAVEYGLIVALIAAVIVAIVAILGGKINTAFKTVSDQLK